MKKNFLSLLLLTSLVIVGCDDDKEEKTYTTFKEYVEIVQNATTSDKNIFIFTQSSCPHCKAVELYFDKYKEEHTDVNVYEITLDKNEDKSFVDKTIGKSTGDSEKDCLKKLDNRIAQYVTATTCPVGETELLNEVVGSNTYLYMYTPLIVWYEGQIEVQFSNNMEQFLEKDSSGVVTYESFENFLNYPEVRYNWDSSFDLSYIPLEEDE